MIRLIPIAPGQWTVGLCDERVTVALTARAWPPLFAWPDRLAIGPLMVRTKGLEMRLELGRLGHVAGRLRPFRSLVWHGQELVGQICRREP